MTKEYHYNWELHLDARPEALWPYVADTNRFNRDTGLPQVERLGVNGGVSHMRFKQPLMNIEWEENPFEWTYPYRFGIVRNYKKGPLAEMRVLCELNPQNGGTLLRYQVWAKARNLLGDVMIPFGIGLVSARRFEGVFRHYDTLAAAGKSPLDAPGDVRLSAGGAKRLQAGRTGLETFGVRPELAARLVGLLHRSDDLSLIRMRPFALADYWGTDRRETLEMFLQAARLGLLDVQWELICPMCRGAAESHGSLGEVHAHSHCPSCQMDFETNFDRQVEVTFRPNPTVRVLGEQVAFCIGSPQRVPHINLAQSVPAGEVISLSTVLDEGPYILRSRLGDVHLRAASDGPQRVDILSNNLPEGEVRVGLMPSLRLHNHEREPLDFMLETGVWGNQAATAVDVTSLQLFRDLFSNEALRAGEQLSISSVTLMFTDLRDSTRMYRQIGDAPAFGRVRQHFEILEQEIAKQGGAVVKTMGDAVMAVFTQPLGAILAIQGAHVEITKTEGTPPLYLKVGIHSGPCIAVTLNERLDYFGSTVNAAARLPGLAEGGEIILSEETANDPQVSEWLAASSLSPAVFETTVKGFEQSFRLWRVKLVL
jgi:class 3 adenylate cyclase